MSSKIAKKPLNGKTKGKKVKRSKLKQTQDVVSSSKSTIAKPRKLKTKPKSKLKSPPKSDVLDTTLSEQKSESISPSSKKGKKNKKRKSDQIKVAKLHKTKPLKKKAEKSLKSSQNITHSLKSYKVQNGSEVAEIKPKRKKPAKAKKRKQSMKIDSLKRQLMSNGIKSPNSAKKISQKQMKSVPQVHSLKKRHHHIHMLPPRPSISGIYGYNKDKKAIKRKRKTNGCKEIKAHKIKKEKVSDRKKAHKIKKGKKKREKTTSPQKLRKKLPSPSKTEKLRNIHKAKTKPKELYVIGDYVHIDDKKCGIIRYKGHLKNVKGIWYGVELLGKHTKGDCDGVFNGHRYFECRGTSGIFVMYQAIDGKMKREAIEKKILKYNKKKEKKKKKQNTNEDKKALNKKLCDDVSIKKVKKKKKKIKKDALKIRSKTMDSPKKSETITPSPNMPRTEGKNDKKSTFRGRQREKKRTYDGPVLVPASSVKERQHDIASKSDYNLLNVLDRGRTLSKNMDNNHRRTRSLSTTRGDSSWMTHRAETKSSDRIKESILAQKQLDLEHLIRSSSCRKKKKKIGKLFQKHIKTAKCMKAKGGGEEGMVSNVTSAIKLRDRLKNEEEAMRNAIDIVKDLGFLKYIKDNEIYSKIYIKQCRMRRDDNEDKKEDNFDLFDMNNIDILSTFHGKTRETLSKVICSAIVSIPGIEIVEMCNADLNDAFMQILVGYLTEYYLKNEQPMITILSLQSNPIADRGMMCLTKLIRMNNRVLNTIKLQNNRRDISTLICQQICEALQQNEFIIRFEFEFRHYQWRDFRDKIIKRNAEKARIQRLQLQKFICV